jgi:hypothetical protein
MINRTLLFFALLFCAAAAGSATPLLVKGEDASLAFFPHLNQMMALPLPPTSVDDALALAKAHLKKMCTRFGFSTGVCENNVIDAMEYLEDHGELQRRYWDERGINISLEGNVQRQSFMGLERDRAQLRSGTFFILFFFSLYFFLIQFLR